MSRKPDERKNNQNGYGAQGIFGKAGAQICPQISRLDNGLKRDSKDGGRYSVCDDCYDEPGQDEVPGLFGKCLIYLICF